MDFLTAFRHFFRFFNAFFFSCLAVELFIRCNSSFENLAVSEAIFGKFR